MSSEQPITSPSPPPPPDLLEAGTAMLGALRNRMRHTVDLAAGELRLAAMSGVSMLLMLVMTAASLLIAWGLIVALALDVLAAIGVPWPYSGMSLTVLHVLLAYLLWRGMLKLSRNLTLPELRQALRKPERPPA